jgi:HrpA-like RNA helicase
MYEKIMDKSIKNKIFLSTDIAESSITLENC